MPKAKQPELDEDPEFEQAEIKSEPDNQQHVPYILNGELYRIESQIGDNVTVKCCYCPPDRIYRGSVRSTGNFHMHIKRRHAFLLGKLHQMKVAALLERRHRNTKNRRVAKNRKKSTTPDAVTGSMDAAAAAASAIEVPTTTSTGSETHELKIKTVFQRHKQEHYEQEEAAIRRSTSSCDSSQDNVIQGTDKLSICSTKQDNNINSNNNNNNKNITIAYNNNNSIQQLRHAQHLNVNTGTVSTLEEVPPATGEAIEMTAMVSIPRMFPFSPIKPEQQQQPQQMSVDQPEAIDLSRNSWLQCDEIVAPNALTHAVQNVEIGIARAQELTAFVNGPSREVLVRIDNSLADIRDEMLARNQIERNRLLLDMAKFKFLHPNFNFDASR
ncbi:protein stand still [Drosophila grimshawi]|uniref:GH22037 n=1 Tax=Drosophila grimshawi TaxID=7222 RepID=B4J9L3_DROGR|nr:protein stand still [Drosophila grimshawi]EDW02520.1 GH22037 [Drosophila grimshawi]